MAIVPLMPAGSIGLVKDVSPAELAPNAWSEVQNVRFMDGEAYTMPADVTLATTAGFQPIWGIAAATTDVAKAIWLAMGAAKAKCLTDNVVTDVTRVSGDYTGTEGQRWAGGVIGGIVVATNGVDKPQAWINPSAATKLVDLANWPSTARCASLRVFKQYLVALDITKSGTRYPTLVKWSHPADPGTVPISWDETDPTRDAGEQPLSESIGAVVDCVPLKDVNIIYKQDSVWGMQFIGGAFVFRFYKIFGDWGMPIRDCAVEFLSGRHFVFTGSDLVVHDGNSVRSVASGKLRKMIRRISAPQLPTCHVVTNAGREEVWFCYRQALDGGLAADTALVYNWSNETLTLRLLPGYRFVTAGRVDPPLEAGATWDTLSGSWDALTREWGSSALYPTLPRLFACGTEKLEWSDGNLTAALTWKLEREHLGVAMKSTAPPDMSARKFVRRVWPRLQGSTGDVVKVSLGVAEGVAKATVWKIQKDYVIGTSEFIDCTLNGRTFAVRFESLSGKPVVYSGLDVDVQFVGNN